MKEYQSLPRVLFITLNAVMGSFFFGYNLSVSNLSWKALTYIYGIDDSDSKDLDYGLFSSTVFFAAGIGALLTSNLLRVLGRRKSMMLTDFVGICGSLLFLISNFWVGLAGRFVSGLAVGLNSAIVPVYINEIAPKSIVALCGTFNQGFVNIGIIVGQCLGLLFSLNEEDLVHQSQFTWRFVYLFPIIPCIIRLFFLTTVYKFDTPHSSIEKNKYEDAKKYISEIYIQEVQDEELSKIDKQITEKNKQKAGLVDMFKQPYRSRTILGIMLQVIQQMSGINGIILFSGVIFEKVSSKSSTARYLAIAASVNLAFFSFMLGPITKKYGRRTILMTGTAGCAVLLAIIGGMSIINNNTNNSYVTIFAIIAIFLYEASFSLSLGPVVWMYNAEILPDAGISISVLTNWLCGFIIGLLLPTLIATIQMFSCFFIFTACMILGYYYQYVNLKETKGLSHQQIVKMFTNITSERQPMLAGGQFTKNSEYTQSAFSEGLESTE